jgi:lipopolysaccharide/colanic/teichoic acid biosynthesis glycosyltransferase
MLKRTFDICVAALALLLFSPVLLTVMLALKLQAQTSVFNLSPRVGKNGRPFRLIRFKTMSDTNAPLCVEERLTRVGKFIRNYSIDDLPNLVNVLRGELSIVGPRPTEPDRVDLRTPEWQQILSVRPGCLSYAVLALAAEFNSSSPDLIRRLELDYIQKQALGYDLRLIERGIRKLIVSKGNVKKWGKPTLDA